MSDNSGSCRQQTDGAFIEGDRNLELSQILEEAHIGPFHVTLFIASLVMTIPAAAQLLAGGYMMPTMQKEFGTSNAQVGIAAASISAGGMIGVLGGGILADYIGRRRAMIFLVAFMLAANLAQACLVKTLLGLVVARLLVGMCSDGLLMTIKPHLVEFLPISRRGAFLTLASLCISAGNLYVIISAQVCNGRWRALVLSLTAPIALALVVSVVIPESPRWLLAVGKPQEAANVVQSLCRWNGTKLSNWRCGGGDTHHGNSGAFILRSPENVASIWSQLVELVRIPGSRYRLLLSSMIFAFHHGAQSSFNVWGPTMMALLLEGKSSGGNENLPKIPYSVFTISELFFPAGLLVTAAVVDVIGTLGMMTFFMSIQQFVQAFHRPTMTNYVLEAFPTPVRATVLGFMNLWGRLAMFVVPGMFGACLHRISTRFALHVLAAMFLCTAVIVVFLPNDNTNASIADTAILEPLELPSLSARSSSDRGGCASVRRTCA